MKQLNSGLVSRPILVGRPALAEVLVDMCT